MFFDLKLLLMMPVTNICSQIRFLHYWSFRPTSSCHNELTVVQ